MTLKRIMFIGTIYILGISFITHNLYYWYPNFITAIFFPVNESVFQHLKMIFTAYMIWGVVEYFTLKRYHLYEHNLPAGIILGATFNMIAFMGIFLSANNDYNYDSLNTIIIYWGTIIISQVFRYFILNTKQYYYKLNFASYILLFIILTNYALFTYAPPSYKPLFFDSENKFMISVYPIKLN